MATSFPLDDIQPIRMKLLSTHKLVAILFLGNVALAYDYHSFFFLANIINPLFLPDSVYRLAPYLQTVAIFATGFLARPIGAWLSGHYGNNRGRKPTYALSLTCLLALSSMAILLPTYYQVGMLGAVLFITVRLLQGVIFGGHIVLGWTYLVESVAHKKLGVLFSLVTAGLFVGVILASSVSQTITATLSPEQLTAYGWRLQFVGGLMLTLCAVLSSRFLVETPLFSNLTVNVQSSDTNNITDDFKLSTLFSFSSAIIITVFLSLILISIVVTVFFLLPELLAAAYSLSHSKLTLAHKFGLIGLILGMIGYGWLVSKIDIGRSLIFGGTLFILQVILFYNVISYSGDSFLYLLYFFLGLSSGLFILCPLLALQLFPTRKRLISFGVVFNIVAVIAGVTLSLGLTYVNRFFALAPAIYLVVVGIFVILIGMALNNLEVS